MHPFCQYHELHPVNIHVEMFDSFCCPLCNIWLEEACTSPACEFCRNRPTYPMNVVTYDDVLNLFKQYTARYEIPLNMFDDDQSNGEWERLYDAVYRLIARNAQ